MTAPTIGATRSFGIPDRHRQLVGSVGVAIAAVLVWQVVSGFIFVVPPPARTIAALFTNLTDPEYLVDVRATAVAVSLAFVIGTALGGILGLVLGLWKPFRLATEPLIIALNGVPKIVLYPILLPIFQLSGSKVVMGVLFCLFPVLINVTAGVRHIPAVYWKLGRSLRASGLQLLVHIILPAIRKPLLTGVRLAVSLAVVGVVLSEFFATRHGLGRAVLQSYSHGDYPEMVATILLLIVVSFAISMLLWRWEKKVQ
ncbi:ABC transporter permease subunit [Intrasporangium sp.]|uniref:ABC transporter permease n=1 Tax=Intrasporangium sp. TaxID=1925024 RepID=UPI003221D6CC